MGGVGRARGLRRGYGSSPGAPRRIVDRILKGAAPADLPVEPPADFDFIVNLKTAKTLSLKLHEPVLQRADELVE